MNAGQVQAWVQQNKTVLLGAGAAGAVGLGLLARKRAGGDANAGASSPAGAPGFSAGAQVAGVAGTYDSSASDLYSALSPELAGIAQKLEALNGSAKTPTPVPAPPSAGIKDGFYMMAGTPNRYQVRGGKIDYLTPAQYQAMTKGQKVKPGVLSPDNPIFGNGGHWLDRHKQTVTPPAAATPAK